MKKIKERERARGVSRRLLFKGLFSAGWRFQPNLNISLSRSLFKVYALFWHLELQEGGLTPKLNRHKERLLSCFVSLFCIAKVTVSKKLLVPCWTLQASLNKQKNCFEIPISPCSLCLVTKGNSNSWKSEIVKCECFSFLFRFPTANCGQACYYRRYL